MLQRCSSEFLAGLHSLLLSAPLPGPEPEGLRDERHCCSHPLIWVVVWPLVNEWLTALLPMLLLHPEP